MENSRRQFLFGSIQMAAWYGVFQLGTSRKAWAKSIRLTARQWADQIVQVASDATAGRLSGEEWQSAIEGLHTRIPLADLIKALDVDRIVGETKQSKERLAVVQDVPIPLTQKQTDKTFGHKLFVYRRGDSTPPHAHNHLVCAHLTLRGNIRARTFNRLQDLERSILLQPTSDRSVGPGHTVSMSDARDNVHWFEGIADVSVTFDVPVGPITPKKKYGHPAQVWSQIYLDPTVPARGDGNIDAPLISFDDAVRKFA